MGGGVSEVTDVPGLEHLTFWNDTIWAAIDGENFPTDDINCLKSYDNKLFMGGGFAYVGSSMYNCIVAWDGTDWISVGDMNWVVDALEVYNGELYAGGIFTGVEGVYTPGIAKWEGGTTWSSLKGGINGSVNDMVVDTFNNFLYVGGVFHQVDDTVLANDVAMWDGFNWNRVGDGFYCDIAQNGMAMYRGELYVAGCFDSTATGLLTNHIARWNGIQWDSIPCGASTVVYALETYKDELYVGGSFSEIGCNSWMGIANFYMPPISTCNYLQPTVNTVIDIFYLVSGEASVQFYNNNAYVDSWEWDFGDTGMDNIKDPLHTYMAIGDYDVQVTVTHGACVKTATKTIHVVLGDEISEIAKLNFKVYPNPSDNFFYVEMDLPENSKVELRISGLNGHTKTKIPITSSKTRINTDGWAKGAYVCNLFVDGKLVRSEKMVITK